MSSSADDPDRGQPGELESYEDFLEREARRRDVEISYARFPIPDGRAPAPELMKEIIAVRNWKVDD